MKKPIADKQKGRGIPPGPDVDDEEKAAQFAQFARLSKRKKTGKHDMWSHLDVDWFDGKVQLVCVLCGDVLSSSNPSYTFTHHIVKSSMQSVVTDSMCNFASDLPSAGSATSDASDSMTGPSVASSSGPSTAVPSSQPSVMGRAAQAGTTALYDWHPPAR
ncbi:hypothetical protein TSOC_013286 [Tetrabaena socialis]|uniref:Uncharacterized protein n=1 Tax=Tetrabaena socialis TaxID=47790 RepID=A0A2J7ZKS2_9CHLO|nr:hypothetical protein TSOC_013286 [Tetrabaena socialis]|eukprot:PNH00863.1 hypothetical protein TSOC_013286 [Tetrabaena socialis]